MKTLSTKQKKTFKQTGPFRVIISASYKKALIEDAKKTGVHYGLFFDTSGKLRCERINPTAQYIYIFQTNKEFTL